MSLRVTVSLDTIKVSETYKTYKTKINDRCLNLLFAFKAKFKVPYSQSPPPKFFSPRYFAIQLRYQTSLHYAYSKSSQQIRITSNKSNGILCKNHPLRRCLTMSKFMVCARLVHYVIFGNQNQPVSVVLPPLRTMNQFYEIRDTISTNVPSRQNYRITPPVSRFQRFCRLG